VLIAMDGDRVDPASFSQRFAEKRIGSTIQLAVMRRDRLLTIAVPVGSREPITYSIKEKATATELEKQIFTSWLAEKNFER
jgi:predicted metalloprotease with PDZ domain